jgi:class 3 adenylate cyclase
MVRVGAAKQSFGGTKKVPQRPGRVIHMATCGRWVGKTVGVVEVADTRFAETPHGKVAYQTLGAHGIDLLVVKPSWFPVDLMWDEPRFATFLTRLSRFSRHIWFDPRGTGASEALPRLAGRFIEDVVEDMVGVLDHLGLERAAVLGGLGPAELLFTATHPERTSALVLMDPFARLRRAASYPGGLPDATIDSRLTMVRTQWGTGATLPAFAPSMADDDRFRRWYSRCERLACSPDDAYWRLRSTFDVDLREVLPAVNVPTLIVLHRGSFSAAATRYVAGQIDDARLVELPGDDHLFFVGDTTTLLDAIEEFLTGRMPTGDHDRQLATVVFTDIVRSTEEAARLGDRHWRDVLAAHDSLVRRELERHRGREVKTMGDGFLVTFDGPARAVRFGCAVRDAISALGIAVRVGVHTGEILVRNDDVSGIAVHISQRVQAHAEAGEVLVSRTVVDLVAGADLHFADRGEQHLKGVPQPWRLFSAESPTTSQ